MRRHGFCVVAALLGGMGAAHADPNGDIYSFISGWHDRAEAALESQPHWIPTLNTISPRLTQVVRYDQYWESTAGGGAVDSFDSGKGFEFIPLETTSFTINPAPYLERNNHDPATGWGDWSLLLVKQRLAAANESEGNYIVTALFGVQAPAGSEAFTNHAWVFTPGIGFGKGWGDFDVQGSIAAALPASRATDIGTAVTTNLTLQYHLSEYLWPEVEFNDAAWTGGPRDGRNQMFMTIGSVFGNLPLTDDYKVGLGLGYQFALTPRYSPLPPTPLYDHNWILSLRLVY
jgi:hypothetical protein